MADKKIHRQELRTFVLPFVLEKIDKIVTKGELGTSRSEVAAKVLEDWAREIRK